MLRAFIRGNQALCARLERRLPNARGHTYALYAQTVARAIQENKVRIAVDVGGGKTCAFAEFLDRREAVKIVAADISADELAVNHSADARVATDLTRGLPFAGESIDLIASRSVLEHLDDLEAFLREAARVMRPGGSFIHWIPCRYAPFAVINRILPHKAARAILYFMEPGVKGICGFRAVYDRCYPSALQRLFEQHGFEIEVMRPSYYQSRYYAFFVPFYLLSSLYEITAQALGLRNLCAHVLIAARKRP